VAGFELFLVVVDAIAEGLPHPLPEIPPAQFIDQFGAVIAVLPSLPQLRNHGIAHLRQGEHAMTNPGREAGHGAVQVVATAAVALCLQVLQLGLCRLAAALDRAQRPLGLRERGREHLLQSVSAWQIARQVSGLGQAGDIFIGISTSGNSANIVRAMEVARSKGLHTVALVGAKAGQMHALADTVLAAPSTRTARIQECHILMMHLLCQLVDES